MYFSFVQKLLGLTHLYTCFVLNAHYDFKYNTDKTCICYLCYSSTRSSCLILFCSVSDVGPGDVEAKRAVEAVEPPVEREWQPNMSYRRRVGL